MCTKKSWGWELCPLPSLTLGCHCCRRPCHCPLPRDPFLTVITVIILSSLSSSSSSPSLFSSPSLVVPSSSLLTPSPCATRRPPCPCLVGILLFAPSSLFSLFRSSCHRCPPPRCSLPHPSPRRCQLLPRRAPQ